MAATRLIALHVNKGKTAAKSIKDRLDYALNPNKTKGEYVSSYECDPHLAWREFILARNAYLLQNVREHKKDVVGYQIRQSFKPGEITPEEANQVGYETAMRFTKGKHAFTVSTHVDKAHIHNHIIFNAVSLDGERKFRDFWRSGLALQKVSDLVCLEHQLSVIQKQPKKERSSYEPPISRLIDIEQKKGEGKGAGYEHWAGMFNLQQAAKSLYFFGENKIKSWEQFEKVKADANEKFHALSDDIKAMEARLKELGRLKKAIIDYSKTKASYAAYVKSGKSEKFYEEHRAEITIHMAAKKVFDEYKKCHPEQKKLPTVKEISQEYSAVLSRKKETYEQYKEAKVWMQKVNNAGINMRIMNERYEQNQKDAKKHRSHRRGAR